MWRADFGKHCCDLRSWVDKRAFKAATEKIDVCARSESTFREVDAESDRGEPFHDFGYILGAFSSSLTNDNDVVEVNG